MGDVSQEHIASLLPPEDVDSPSLAPEPTAEEQAAEKAADVAAQAEITEAATEQTATEQTPEVETSAEKMVKLAALHEERGRRQTAEAQLKQSQAAVQTMTSLKEQLTEMRAREQKTTDAEQKQRDEAQQSEDPIGFLTKQTVELRNEMTRIQAEGVQKAQTADQAQAQQNDQQAFMANVTAQTTQYAADNPGYGDELAFVLDKWRGELTALGQTDPQQIDQSLTNRAMQLSWVAMQNGRNPGESVHEIAKGWGFTAPDPATTEDGRTQEDLEAEMAKLQQGQQAAKTLSGGGGKSPDGDLSLQGISDMSDQQFDDLWSSLEGENGAGSIY